MIRSFKDKLKKKQEAYEAKQQVLAEQAKQARIKREWEQFDREREDEQIRVQQVLKEEAIKKEQEYLKQKRIQDEKNRIRIEEFEAWKSDELVRAELSKKIIAEGKIADTERYIAQSKQKPKVKKNKGINEGAAINAASTWQLTWKSFSTHPDIINLPIGEKVRLYKLAEQRQIDRTNYYANLHSVENSLGQNFYWEDGVVTRKDVEDYNLTIISEDTVWTNSVNVDYPISISAGVTLTIQGVLTANAIIQNYGHIIVHGIVMESGNIQNIDSGQLEILN